MRICQEYFPDQFAKQGPLTCVRIFNTNFARYVCSSKLPRKEYGHVIQIRSIGYRIAKPQSRQSYREIRQLQTRPRAAQYGQRANYFNDIKVYLIIAM